MYSPVTLRKFLPDGSLKFVVSCYRLEDRAGFIRFFLPTHTPRVMRSANWTPEGTTIAVLDPDRDYVVHYWQKERDRGFYVDAARSVVINAAGASYVDLLLDLAYWEGTWRTLDEHEIGLLSASDAIVAKAAIDECLSLGVKKEFPFDPEDDLWSVSAEARALPALPTPAWDG